jgi:Tfp pilus assembly protein PilO
MNRSHLILASLVAVLVVALSWFFLFAPRNAEIEEIRAETERLDAQASELAAQVEELRQVRENAPVLEAELAAAQAVLPRESALPSTLRQLQLAADEAGVTLSAVAPSRPQPVTIESGEAGLAKINLVVDVKGRYFQMVDFLRRLEDPAISPRGLLWNALSIESEYDAYPVLEGSLQGDLFAILPATELAAPPVEPDTDADVADEGDVELDDESTEDTL